MTEPQNPTQKTFHLSRYSPGRLGTEHFGIKTLMALPFFPPFWSQKVDVLTIGSSGINMSYDILWHMGVSKKIGIPPKWMVYNRKPYEQMDDLGFFPTIFGNAHIGSAVLTGSGPVIPASWTQKLKQLKPFQPGPPFDWRGHDKKTPSSGKMDKGWNQQICEQKKTSPST